MNRPAPRFFYLCGCDGTGKSTQAALLAEGWEREGIRVRRVWLRFPFLLSRPLLAYARWRRLSWYEESAGVRQGYWDFRQSRILRILLPWILLVDAATAAIFHIYVPLALGETVVCERFVIDMLADLMVAFDDHRLAQALPGRLYPLLIPRWGATFVLDLDAETLRTRRESLRADRRLAARVAAFRSLSREFGLDLLSGEPPPAEVQRQILLARDAHV